MTGKLVALAAALVVLAGGIALGAGPLQHGAADRDRQIARQKATIADRDQRIDELQGAAKLGSAYAGATAAKVVAGTLSGRKVAILALPGADPETVDLLGGLVHAAGGEVTARVTLTSTMLVESGRGLLDALTSQMVTQTSGLTVSDGASAYQRLGLLLARGIGVPASAHVVSASYDTGAISIVSGLEAAKVIDKAQVTARAGLTLVVLPADAARTDRAAASVLTAYAGQIPTVVAGPAAAAAPRGLLAALRASTTLRAGTVDSLDTGMGRVAAVLALAARTRGAQGDYGVVGKVDAAVPPTS